MGRGSLTVEDVGLSAPGYAGDGISSPGYAGDGGISSPGYYGDGISSPGYYGDGVTGLAEEVMTLAEPVVGRSARGRSMGGKLREQMRRGRGLQGLGSDASELAPCLKSARSWDELRDPQGRPLERNRRYGFDDDREKCVASGGCFTANLPGISDACWFKDQGARHFPSYLDPAYDWAVTKFNDAFEARTGINPGIPTTPKSSSVPGPTLTQMMLQAKLAAGKGGAVAPKSKVVPIVIGGAAVGLLLWLL